METKATRKRKKHAEEFKREAVRLMENRGERTVAEIAASLGVAENLLLRAKARLADPLTRSSKRRAGPADVGAR